MRSLKEQRDTEGAKCAVSYVDAQQANSETVPMRTSALMSCSTFTFETFGVLPLKQRVCCQGLRTHRVTVGQLIP